MNQVKIQNDVTRHGFQMTAWGYIALGLIGAFVGLVVGSDGEGTGIGLAIMFVSAVPLTIGVIAQGVRVALEK